MVEMETPTFRLTAQEDSTKQAKISYVLHTLLSKDVGEMSIRINSPGQTHTLGYAYVDHSSIYCTIYHIRLYGNS